MSFFEKRYYVKDWKGKRHLYTAKQLYKKILKDSKSDYNWIAPATELIRVCQEPNFPEMYAMGIKLMILNCFGNIEVNQSVATRIIVTDKEAVNYCYNSLPTNIEAVTIVKQKYLATIIVAFTKSNAVKQFIHHGATYDKICSKWRRAIFDEYVSKKVIDFKQLKKELLSNFEHTIKTAEDKGIFEKDDAEYFEHLKMYFL